MRRALLLLALVGCAEVPTQAPETVAGERAAMSAILATYGAPAALGAPAVRWHVDDLDCEGTAWTPPSFKTLEGYRPGLGCVRGLFDQADPDEVQIALPGGSLSPAAVASLAHEAAHWFLFASTGDADTDHRGPYFAPGGQVDRAAAAALGR